MNRRVRHLNPASFSAAAVLALYSNWQTGFSNGDPVGTFSGRAGTSLAPTASGSLRPTFTTGSQGGQAVLSFDGGDIMSGPGQLPSATMTAVLVYKQTQPDRSLISTSLAGQGWSYAFLGGLRDFLATGVTQREDGAISADWEIVTLRRDGTTAEMRVNGVGQSIASPTSAQNDSGTDYYLGQFNGVFYFIGLAAVFAVFPAALSPGLMKRLEQSVAYQFKLATA